MPLTPERLLISIFSYNDLMRRLSLALLVLALAGFSWRLLGLCIVSGSERFYLLLPPTFLGLYIVFSPKGWRGLKAHSRSATRYLVCLTLFGLLCYLFLTASLVPISLRSFRSGELLVAVYFLVALSLLVATPLAVLKAVCRRSADRLLGPQAHASQADNGIGNDLDVLNSVAQRFLREALPAILLVPILLPYLLGAMYVHRLKIPNPYTPRELLGRDYEDVAFTTADGLTIRGWFLPAGKPSSRTLLICHGLGANRTNFLTFIPVGDALEANILMFDFRGHGDSDGHTVTFGYWEKLDILAAAQYLRRDRPEQCKQLFALGISMGASSLTQAAADVDPPFDAVILDSCFASAVELTDNILGAFPPLFRPCLTVPGIPIASLHAGCRMDEVRPIDRIASIRAPLLLIHAKNDMLIPAEHTERLFSHAVDPKLKWIADTGDHSSAWSDRRQYLAYVKLVCDDGKAVVRK